MSDRPGTSAQHPSAGDLNGEAASSTRGVSSPRPPWTRGSTSWIALTHAREGWLDDVAWLGMVSRSLCTWGPMGAPQESELDLMRSSPRGAGVEEATSAFFPTCLGSQGGESAPFCPRHTQGVCMEANSTRSPSDFRTLVIVGCASAQRSFGVGLASLLTTPRVVASLGVAWGFPSPWAIIGVL